MGFLFYKGIGLGIGLKPNRILLLHHIAIPLPQLAKGTPVSINGIAELSGHKVNYTLGDENRIGDHICYYSDLSRLRNDYPNWDIRHSLKDIVSEMVKAEENKVVTL